MAVVPGRQAAGRCRSPPTLDAGSPECFYDRRVVKAGVTWTQVTGSRTEHAGSEVKQVWKEFLFRTCLKSKCWSCYSQFVFKAISLLWSCDPSSHEALKHSSQSWAVGLSLESDAAEAYEALRKKEPRSGPEQPTHYDRWWKSLSYCQPVMVLHGWDMPSVGGRCRPIVSSVESLPIDWSQHPLVTVGSVLLLLSFWEKKCLQSCGQWRLILCVTWLGLTVALDDQLGLMGFITFGFGMKSISLYLHGRNVACCNDFWCEKYISAHINDLLAVLSDICAADDLHINPK